MNLIKLYVVLFRRPISPQEYAERARLAFGYGPSATVVGIPPSDETFAKNAIREVCGDIWSMTPIPEVKMEKGDPERFRNEPIPGGGMNEYAIDFLKRKISEGEDPDYFNLAGYTVNVTTSADRITGDGALIIHIYSNGARALKPSEASAEKRHSMKELVQALVEADSKRKRWEVVGSLTTGAYRSEIVTDEEGLKMLREALGSQDSEICGAAAYVLRFWPDERAFKPLLRCVGLYPDTWRSRWAADALDSLEETIGKFSAVAELYTQALMDEDPVIQRAASERFKTHPIVQIRWLDQEGKPLLGRYAGRLAGVSVEKNTKTSTLLEYQLEGLHLPKKTSEGREIEYLLQTDDGKRLDMSETLEKNLQEQRIDSLIVSLRIVPRLKEAPPAPSIVPARPTIEEVKPPEPAAKKYCIYCGSEMPVEGMYCPRCGKKQVEEETGAKEAEAVAKLQKPTNYLEECFSLPYEEFHDDRRFGDVPEMLEVAKLGNAGRVDEALRLAESVLLKHPDLDNVYYWLGHLHNSKGRYEKAKEVLTDGIQKSKRKYSLYELFGDIEYSAGKLREAVKWWIRSVVSQINIKEKVSYGSFLYLAYVSEAMGLRVIALKLFNEVDAIRAGKIRLTPSAQTNIYRLVKTQGTESMRSVLEELYTRLS